MTQTGIPISQAEACLWNLKLSVAKRGDPPASFDLSNRTPYLAEFLAICAQTLTTKSGEARERYSNELYHARDVFVRAGLEALDARPWQTGNDWMQFGIRPAEDPALRRELCRELASLARRLLSDSDVDNFFFMNKPPGIRLRFQIAAAENSAHVAHLLHCQVARWRAEGLIDHVEAAVYEPESQLFGGPRSMSFVHALFTLDSLIWLDYQSGCLPENEAISPAWLVSLAVLRSVFAGLDIKGWEDLGVWDNIRQMCGRRLGADKVTLREYAEVAGQIRDLWSRRKHIIDELHPAVRAIVTDHESALITGAAQWRSGYFCQRGASLGPRAAAAFYVIFHWNRAGLSSAEQALLADSLSERIINERR